MENCLSTNNQDKSSETNVIRDRCHSLESNWITDNNEFAIFRQDNTRCDGKWTKCASIKRLLAALKHYSVSGEHIFCKFIDEVYNVQMLDDYSHFIKEHDDDLYEINQTMKNENVCSIGTCAFSSRHHRQTERETKDEKFGFYADTMDSLHYHLMHLFECGMRVKENEKESVCVDDRFYDAAFAQLIKTVNGKRTNLQIFDRFQVADKFSLCNDNDLNSNTTFLDEVIKKLQSKNFLSVVKDEEFETESIKMDIMDANANLFQILSKEKKINLFKNFIANIKRQNDTFSIGYRFFYWPKHQYMEKEEADSSNIIDYGGYKVSELYVNQKYKDFKQEMMAYSNITMDDCKKIMAKATIWLRTETAKKIQVTKTDLCAPNYYGFFEYLSLWNLIALILYTDFDAHCSEFSASFRKLSPFESLKVTKERNRNFWWMAKTLRETVELFGKCRDGGNAHHNEKADKKRGMYGPFYTGISRKMVVSQFNIRLNAPTSTSTKLSVALIFGGNEGIIIQLNNDCRNRIDALRGFDVSWLSRYREESERLFIGGYYMMRVESIRLIETRQNFEQLIYPLWYLDAMITGKLFNGMHNFKINETGKKLIEDLFEYRITQKIDKKIDEYIYECFEAFVQSKESLYIAFVELSYAENFMSRMIVHSIKIDHVLKNDNDQTNLIRSGLVSMFPNVVNVHIRALSHCFSLLRFLTILKASKWQKVTIQGGKWMSILWNSQKMASIIKEYRTSIFEISYKLYESNPCLSISKVNSE